jgi:glutathione synthase/RimK-type ligase-like ATP-grasp enzyme
MGNFLIATAANDIHAIIVAQALRSIGHECFRWVTSDYPSAQRCSISYTEGARLDIEGLDGLFSVNFGTSDLVFWNRRIIREHFVSTELSAADRVIAASQSKVFVHGILPFLDRSCTCINKIYASERAESKTFQLMMAKRAGFIIPDTVISNDPIVIRKFVEGSRGTRLAKPFSPTVWKGENGDLVTRSAIVGPDDLPGDLFVQTCPMIFQSYVEKSYEVRITCFGNLPVAVRINSQEIAAARVDWRAVSPAKLGVERVEVPPAVQSACLSLLSGLDLAFGCIDMIVTPENEWVFLEINQMGQFLWVEEINPDVHMLDLFVQLLTGTHDIDERNRKYGLRHQHFMSSASAELREEQPLRAPKVGVNVVEDH